MLTKDETVNDIVNGMGTHQKLSEKIKHIQFCNFVIQTDHLIPVKRPNLVLINKKRQVAV